MFPCRPGDKRPAVPDWENRACVDPERVARFWPSDRHNIGIACGPSGLIVLDLDTHGDLPDDWRMPGIHDGRDVLAQLCEWAGRPWPSTHMVATPSGGWHLYLAAPEGSQIRNSASLLGPQVDVRAAGGYVVGAGSVVDGRQYEVLDSGIPEPLPGWIEAMLARRPEPGQSAVAATERASAGSSLTGLLRTVATAPVGRRNDALYWAACRAAEMAAAGKVGAEAAAAFLRAEAVAAGLTEREACRTVASAMRGDR